MKDLKDAYRRLAEAQASNDAAAATAAYQEIGRLIESLPDQATSAIPGMGFDDDDENLTVEEKLKKVEQALFDAAQSGNVPAILKFFDMHPPGSTPAAEEPVKTKGQRRRKKTRKPRISKKLTMKETKFLEHFFTCDECKGNGTKAAGHAGYKGDDNTLAVTAFRLLRNPKIQEYVQARLEASAMSIEDTLRGMSETAQGMGQHVIELSNGVPVVNLAKAITAGKLHLIKSVHVHPNGQVKAIAWDSPLQAKIALARFHQLGDPGEPPDRELTAEEISRLALSRARVAIELAMSIAKKHGKDLTLEEAAERAARFGFPEAKEVLSRGMDSKATN